MRLGYDWATQARRLALPLFAMVTDRRYRRGNEMAQPVAGAFLSPRLCRARCPLFPTLGRSETFRNYFFHRRGTRPGPSCSDTRLRRRRGRASDARFNEPFGFTDQLLEGLR